MFIEVYLNATIGDSKQIWNFVFNSKVFTILVRNEALPILTIELTTSKTALKFDSMEDANSVYEAFKCALTGMKNKVLREGLGYVKPIQRPFMDETILVPSALEGEILE